MLNDAAAEEEEEEVPLPAPPLVCAASPLESAKGEELGAVEEALGGDAARSDARRVQPQGEVRVEGRADRVRVQPQGEVRVEGRADQVRLGDRRVGA